jgi:Ni,Fe-hydrogenase III small subunit/ferredoxin
VVPSRSVALARHDALSPRRGATPAGFRARALLDPDAIGEGDAATLAAACLPGALSVDAGGSLRLDGSRCIGCGLCVNASRARAVTMDPGYELATRSRERLVVDGAAREADVAAGSLGGPFRRSLHIRHVDTGSDGAVEQEIAALLNPYYDMHRLGVFFTATPRHADVLLVTGPVTRPMEEPLHRTYEAMPEPRVVVAAGTEACSGSIWTAPEVLGGGRPGAARRRVHPGRSAESDRAAARPVAGRRACA